jgi:hypothetical protein
MKFFQEVLKYIEKNKKSEFLKNIKAESLVKSTLHMMINKFYVNSPLRKLYLDIMKIREVDPTGKFKIRVLYFCYREDFNQIN